MNQVKTGTAGKVSKSNLNLVSEHDILEGYTLRQDCALGSEAEHVVLHPDQSLITKEEHMSLRDIFARSGLNITDEPLASIMEVKTSAFAEGADVITEMTDIKTRLFTAIRDRGYVPHEIGYLGEVTLDEAYAHRFDGERMKGLIENFRASGQEISARQPLMTASVHMSISYRDIDHAFQMGKHLMVLTPALTALCANGGNRFDGQNCIFNPTATIRLSQPDGRGGLSPVIGKARDARQMMQLQAHHLCTTPMMMHLDENSTMRVTDLDGRHPTLQDLAARELNTASNALLSESMQYHLLKFTSLRDRNGAMTGKRLELRMADNGPFQHDLMAMVADAVALRPAFAWALECALIRMDLNPFATDSGAKAEAALSAVAKDQAGAMHVPFGKANIGQVNDLVLTLLETHGAESLQGRLALRQARQVLGL